MRNLVILGFSIVFLAACSQDNVADVSDNVAQKNAKDEDMISGGTPEQPQEQDGTDKDDLTEEIQIIDDTESPEQDPKPNPDPDPDPDPDPEEEEEDSIPPSDANIEIDSSEYTANTTVTLALSAVDATEMYITNDPNCETGGNWEPYATTKEAWTLGEMNTETSVFVKYQDDAQNETNCISDSITHDQNAPTDPTGIDDGAYTIETTESPIISWTASTDAESEIAYYEVSIGTSPGDDSIKMWTNVGNVTSINFNDVSLASGMRYYANIRAVDLLGNTSDAASSSGFFYNYCYSIKNNIENNGAWIFVPGDADYGTNDFCVMKYEAKNVNNAPASLSSGIPWTNIDQGNARTECASLGPRYHLITNPEWMTLAANMANVGSNWSGTAVGNGALFIGHSDGNPNQACQADADDSKAYIEEDPNDPTRPSCQGLDGTTAEQLGGNEELLMKRTHQLSHGDVIWDISGNVREWIDLNVVNTDKPQPRDNVYNEFPAITDSSSLELPEMIPTNGVKAFWIDTWNSVQRIGKARIGASGSGGAMSRGGGFNGNDRNGLFRIRLDHPSTQIVDTLGFRCAFDIP